jgi:nucleotide-binding universal stress UspA family protein
MSKPVAQPVIVVGVDGSPASKVAVDWAARDAAMRSVPLTLAHAISPTVAAGLGTPMPPGLAQWQKARGRQIIDDARRVVEQSGGPAQVDSELLFSGPVSGLVDMSKDADLIVVGCRGHGALRSGLLGSVSAGLVGHAHCPVAVIHDEDPLMPHPAQAPVLVGIDGSPSSELATAIAFDEASRRGVGDVVGQPCAIDDFPGLLAAASQVGDVIWIEPVEGGAQSLPGPRRLKRVAVGVGSGREAVRYQHPLVRQLAVHLAERRVLPADERNILDAELLEEAHVPRNVHGCPFSCSEEGADIAEGLVGGGEATEVALIGTHDELDIGQVRGRHLGLFDARYAERVSPRILDAKHHELTPELTRTTYLFESSTQLAPPAGAKGPFPRRNRSLRLNRVGYKPSDR